MGIYYNAVDFKLKKFFDPPKGEDQRYPGIINLKNKFPGMILMMNIRGYNFEIMPDGCPLVPYPEDMSEEVYQLYEELFPSNEEEDE